MKSKKLLAAALAAVLTLAGCGTTVLSAEETKELLTLSQKTMATVESMAAEMTMEMDMSMGEETAETTTVAKILTQQNPLRMQMNLSATLEDGTEAQNMQMYAEEEDGKLRTYVLAADTWYSQTMELGGLAQYNAEENVTLYLSNLADFSATATEKINDTEATKIEGTLKKDVLQKVLAESGMTETAAAMGVTEEQLATLTESVKSLPLTLWIDADGYVLKYEMNLTEVMQKIMDKAMEAAGSYMAVLVKTNMRDGFRGGLEIDDCIEVARNLEACGAHALVLSGGFVSRAPMYVMRGQMPIRTLTYYMKQLWLKAGVKLAGRWMIPSVPFREAYFYEDALQFRKALKLPLVYVGGLVSREKIDMVLDSGFECVAMARALINEPDFVNRMKERGELRCGCEHTNYCIARMYSAEMACHRHLQGLPKCLQHEIERINARR